MSLAKRLHLFLRALPFVLGMVALKWIVHQLGYEFMPLDGLVPHTTDVEPSAAEGGRS